MSTEMNNRIKKGFKMEVIEHGIITISGPSACGKSSYCMDIAAMFGMPVRQVVTMTEAGFRAFADNEQFPLCAIIEDCWKKDLKRYLPCFREFVGLGWMFVVVINPGKQ